MKESKESLEKREGLERLRKTRAAIIIGGSGQHFGKIVEVMEGLGIKANRIARRLSRGKTLSATQYYKIS